MHAAIYYSNSYESEHRAQSEDRGIHHTKSDPLTIIDLVTEGTVDELVLESLQDKSGNSRRTIERAINQQLARKRT